MPGPMAAGQQCRTSVKNGILLNSDVEMYRIHRRSQVSVFSRTVLANRLGIGGVVTLFIVAFALLGVGTVASAEPANQAATATATPTAATAATAATAVPCVNTGRGVQ